MKYRKKPIVVEAIQYDGTNGYTIQTWSEQNVLESPVLEPTNRNPSGKYLQVKTPEGMMTAIYADWIIKGVKGEYYPCKPDVFELTYEDVE